MKNEKIKRISLEFSVEMRILQKNEYNHQKKFVKQYFAIKR